MKTIKKLLNRIFNLEIINGCGLSDYLHRWTLLKLWGGRRLYIHHFLGSDWSRDLHDHPKLFISIGLRGGYVEEHAAPFKPSPPLSNLRHLKRKQYRAPWLRWFKPLHRHRLRVPPGGRTWSLVYTGPAKRQWGFWHKGKWIVWDRYVHLFGGPNC